MTEMLEFVDDDNEVIGTMDRDTIHRDQLPHRSVHVLLFRHDGAVYLHKRTSDRVVMPDRWDVSSAGHVGIGEGYAQAARRELAEELGPDMASRVGLVPFYASMARPDVGYEFAALYWGTVPKGVLPKPDPTEIAEGRWFTPSDLLAFLRDPAPSLCPSLLNGLRVGLDLIPAMRKWHAAERDAVRLAIENRAEVAPPVPNHAPSLAMAQEDRANAPAPRLEFLADRIVWLAVVAALFVAANFYPLLFSEETQRAMAQRYVDGDRSGLIASTQKFLILDSQPFYLGSLGPLVLKEAGITLLILAALPAFALLALIRPTAPLWRRSIPMLIVGLLLWATTSVAFVLPPAWLFQGSPKLMSLFTFLVLMAMTAFVARGELKRRRLLVLSQIPLAIMLFVALGQHHGAFDWLPRAETIRNRMSSLIGHNNGVASLWLYAWFPAMAFAMSTRTSLTRIASLVALMLLTHLLVALQTRAIWGIALVLTPVAFWLGQQAMGRVMTMKHVGAAAGVLLLVAVATSLTSAQSIPLTQRLGDFSPGKIRRSTQYRIVTVALPFMADRNEPNRFLKGVGFGSFQAVYPTMLAQYLQDKQMNVDLYLTSSERTAQAHSDIMQMYIELGLVGVMIICGIVYLFARQSRMLWEAAPTAGDKLWLLALLFPLVGTMMHALIEFPFHLAPIMAFFVVYLGMALAAVAERMPLPVTWNPVQMTIARGGTSGRLATIACLAVSLAAGVFPFLHGSNLALSIWEADFFRTRARANLGMVGINPDWDSNQRQQIVRDAIGWNRMASRLTPMDPENRLVSGQMHIQQAMLDAANIEDTSLAQGERDAWKRFVRFRLNQAVNDLDRAENEGLNYFMTHYTKSIAYAMIAKVIEPHEQETEFITNRIIALQESVRMNPAFLPALTSLLDIAGKTMPDQKKQLALLRQLLRRYGPEEYDRRYKRPLAIASKNGEWERGMRILAALQADDPMNPDLAYAEVALAASCGKLAEARSALARVDQKFPGYPLRDSFAITPEIRAKNFTDVRRLADAILAKPNPPQREFVEAARALAAEGLGEADAAGRLTQVETQASVPPPAGIAALDGYINALIDMGYEERALPWIIQRIAYEADPADTKFYRALAKSELTAGHLDRVDQLLEEGLSHEPNDLRLRELVVERFGSADTDDAKALAARVVARHEAILRAAQRAEFEKQRQRSHNDDN